MLRRFASASVVVSVGIAFGALMLYGLAHIYKIPNPYVLALVWCTLPVVWGVWAMLTPKAWMPDALPSWGAALGLLVGVMGLFVLNVPGRVLGITPSLRMRAVGVLVAVAAYYLLWMVVRWVYRMLTKPAPAQSFKVAA